MSALDAWLVDVFISRAFTGNVAGVVPNADDLSDAQMQAIADELHAGATAFVSKPTRGDAAVALRWFSPRREIELCGHATLAAVHVLLAEGRFSPGLDAPGIILPIETRHRGLLTVRTQTGTGSPHDPLIWLDLPDATLRPAAVSIPEFCKLLALDPALLEQALAPAQTAEGDLILAVQDVPALFSFQPRFGELAEVCRRRRVRGVLVTTARPLTPAVACQSRFFAPAYGIDEDTVTGSVHGPLGVFLAQNGAVPLVDGQALFTAAQSQLGGRAGLVRVVVTQRESGWHVRVGGYCTTTLRGGLTTLPEALPTATHF